MAGASRRRSVIRPPPPFTGGTFPRTPALAPRLIMQRIRDLHTTTLEAPELRSRILHLKGKQQPFPVEHIATGRLGRMLWGHEREAKWMVANGREVDEPRCLEHDVEAEPPDIEVATLGAPFGHHDRV